MPLDDMFRKINAIQEFDVVKETADIIKANAEFMQELLRSQLSKGKDGKKDNVTIFGRDYYKDRTIWEKDFHGTSALAKVTDWITNYMSGDFYLSLGVITKGETFELSSSVGYFGEIIRRSGSVIMELDEDNLKRFSEEILFPQMQTRFTQKFNAA